jgi:integrase
LFDHYRCKALFDRLVEWLRSKGIDKEKPLHELRKEFDSKINDKYGIHAASRMLRHASIRITDAHYTDIDRKGPHYAASEAV